MLDKKKGFLCSETSCEEQNDYKLPFGDIKDKYLPIYRINLFRGTWVAQLVGHPTSAQVMISLLVSWRPMLGSALAVQSLDPASDSVPVSLPLPCSHSLSQI